jgi:hypothetical protein
MTMSKGSTLTRAGTFCSPTRSMLRAGSVARTCRPRVELEFEQRDGDAGARAAAAEGVGQATGTSRFLTASTPVTPT